jgi:hypothetical protein
MECNVNSLFPRSTPRTADGFVENFGGPSLLASARRLPARSCAAETIYGEQAFFPAARSGS